MMVRSVFDDLPKRYDRLQKQALPNWQAFFSTVVEYIPEGTWNILELGSGTGFLTSMIRNTMPQASITCIDRDPAMLEIAKVKPELEGVTFIEGDILKTWPEGTFDLVASTQCLFALPADERRRIFGRIHDSLSPDGVFIEGDIFRPENRWEGEIYRSGWKRYMLEQDMLPEEAEEMLRTLDNVYDSIETLEETHNRLKEAGFRRIFSPYWYEMYGVIVASV